jgi:hypothetical protein
LKRVGEMFALQLCLFREGGHPLTQFLKGRGREQANVPLLPLGRFDGVMTNYLARSRTPIN